MFRAQPMLRVDLWVLLSEASDVAALLARFGAFNPTAGGNRYFPDAVAERYREVFQEADSRLGKIIEVCGESALPEIPDASVAPTLAELEQLNHWLQDVWKTCLAYSELQTGLEDERKRLASLRETLQRLKALNLDLAQLLRPSALLDVRIGSVPRANIKRLGESLAIAGYLLHAFDEVEDLTYLVVTGPRHGSEDVHSVLGSAGWRELPVPKALLTHPAEAELRLREDSERLVEATERQCLVLEATRQGFNNRLDEARVQLTLARPLAEASVAGVRGRGQLSQFSGWVPRASLKRLEAALQARFPERFVLSARKPRRDERAGIPTLLNHPTWLGHFAELVKSYGVPRYGEFDPSLLFAVAYVVLFGAMFGDVGHGAVIFVGALFLRGKLAFLRTIGIAASLSAIAFGFLYGSIFGYKELIEPIWQSPLHNPGLLLLLAVRVGVGFICVTLVINVANLLYFGRVRDALFLPGGLAGLLLYVSAVSGTFRLFEHGDFGWLNLVGALVGLLALAAYTWFETQAGFAERLLVTVIESFEAVINLISNTLSFLRVAAFSMNHVALALAVFTLAAGMSTAGHWLTVVLGNVVIIVLEGAIVAIQTLRLMYYEGFSRFYNGDGRAFKPLRLTGDARH
ncbi:MAG: V-type ATP synthase subunit I [Thiotrichales bacterium]